MQKSNGLAKFYYAGIDDLPATGVLHDVDLTVQIRHEPGVQAPELVLPELKPVTHGIDPRLQKWLE